MGVYRSRNALASPLTADRLSAVELPRTSLGRRGYRTEDVDALLHRLVYELGERTRLLDDTRGENDRIKRALRAWQAEVRETAGVVWSPAAIPDSRYGPDGRRAG
ncbi:MULTISPECIES: DivIVA domain-containing protein [unclassified Micromonospora]|uniref:DivIVA domain-containing protein n=1 Tax=unclassified Micromonospora TaxID=2617518 RepID=UPI001C22D96C|nr:MULTISPECIES: DivIVA domain-containing protein [unclassified Micromonospora]MBU8856220.1 DivIVA domain-containing protein [Micromonospora sp. WMMB482]MDM4781827.1 DivIVA domain-containing protein [Micromonospora sp. b486]